MSYLINYRFLGRLKIARDINPVPNSMDPATKGKPDPTRSSIRGDHRKGKQNSIPNMPASIVITHIPFIIIFIV